MKITGYQQSVTNVGGSGATPRVDYSASAKAAASSALDYTPIIKGLSDVANTINYVHEQEDRKNVLAAMDDYNRQMNDLLTGEGGLLNRQLGEAEGITDIFTEKEKAIRESTLGKTKLYFRGNQDGLQHSLNSSSQQGLQRVAQWQYKQSEAVSNLRAENIVNDNIETAQSNYDNEDIVKNCRVNIANALGLLHGKKGPEYMETVMRQQLGKLGTSLLDSAMAHNDMNAAANFYRDYKQFMTPEQRNKFEQKSINIQVGNQQRTMIDGWLQEGISVEEAMKRIDSMDGYSVNNINAGNGSFESFMQSIATQESGGDYDLVNKDTGASGKYQIMPENWPVWSKEAGLEEGAKMTPENQEKVAKFKLKQYYDKYGARGAAIAWYAGEGAITYSDAALNRKQGNNGEYPSINEYADQVTGRMGSGAASTKVSMNMQQRQELKNLFLSAYNQKQNIARLHDKDVYNDVVSQAVEMAKQGISITDALQKLAYDKVGSEFISAKSAVTSAYSGLKVGGSNSADGEYGKGSNPLIVSAIKDSFYKFKTKADAIEYAKSKGLSQSDVNKIYTAYDQYLTGEGEFAYKWGNIKQRVLSKMPGLKGAAQEQAWADARAAGVDYIRTYQTENNGNLPGEADIIAKCQQGMLRDFEFSYKKSGALLSSKIKYSKGAMDLAGIRDISESDSMPGYMLVVYKNNKAEYLPAETVAEKLGGEYK